MVQPFKQWCARALLVACICNLAAFSPPAQALAKYFNTWMDKWLFTMEIKAAVDPKLRPQVVAALMEAQRLLREDQIAAAIAKTNEAENNTGLSAYERHLIARVRGTIASVTGNADWAAEQYDIAASGFWLTDEEKARAMALIGNLFYAKQNYASAITWYDRYFDAGGTDMLAGQLRAQSYFLLGQDYSKTAKVLAAEVNRYVDTGQTPPEGLLKMLMDSRMKASEIEGYAAASYLWSRYYPH